MSWHSLSAPSSLGSTAVRITSAGSGWHWDTDNREQSLANVVVVASVVVDVVVAVVDVEVMHSSTVGVTGPDMESQDLSPESRM